MPSSDDRTFIEVLAVIIGCLVMILGLEFVAVQLYHCCTWWTFYLLSLGVTVGFQVIKSTWKAL